MDTCYHVTNAEHATELAVAWDTDYSYEAKAFVPERDDREFSCEQSGFEASIDANKDIPKGSSQTTTATSQRASVSAYPRRIRWNDDDTKLLCVKFEETTRPGKAAIRKKFFQDEDLKKLMTTAGFERCYEKVKTIYRKREKTLERKRQ